MCLIDLSVLLSVMASLTTSAKLSSPEMSEIAGREKNDILLKESGHVEHAVHYRSAIKDDTSNGKIVWTLSSSVTAVSLCVLYVGRKSTLQQNDPALPSDRLTDTALLCRWLFKAAGTRTHEKVPICLHSDPRIDPRCCFYHLGVKSCCLSSGTWGDFAAQRIVALAFAIAFVSGINFYSYTNSGPLLFRTVFNPAPVTVGLKGLTSALGTTIRAVVTNSLLSTLKGHNREHLLFIAIIISKLFFPR